MAAGIVNLGGMWGRLHEINKVCLNHNNPQIYMTTNIYVWLERSSLLKPDSECYPPIDCRVGVGSSGDQRAVDCALNLLDFIDSRATLIRGLPNSVCIISEGYHEKRG